MEKLRYSCLSVNGPGRNRYRVKVTLGTRVLFEGLRHDLTDAGSTADRYRLLYARLGTGSLT